MKLSNEVKLMAVLAIGSLAVGMIFGGKIENVFRPKKGNQITKTQIQKKPPAEKAKVNPQVKTEPTIKPVSFQELNNKYGPCYKVNVLMYHHIQEESEAKKLNQTSLTVTPEWLDKQIGYLLQHKYNIIGASQLAEVLNNGGELPTKPVVLTFDDAYEDNFKNAFPVLKKYGVNGIIFTPTGLVTVPGYLNWGEINEMKDSGLVYFGNHTWSHHSSAGPMEEIRREITTADTQLKERDLNQAKIFAYPYGKPSADVIKVLKELDYSLAFTTTHGNIMCKGQKYQLPRIRVGNAPLSNYGL